MFSIVGQISHLHIFTGPPLRRLQVDQHVVKQVLIMYCVCVSKVKPYTYTIYFTVAWNSSVRISNPWSSHH